MAKWGEEKRVLKKNVQKQYMTHNNNTKKLQNLLKFKQLIPNNESSFLSLSESAP